MNVLSLPWLKIVASSVVVWEKINGFFSLISCRKAPTIKNVWLFFSKEENWNTLNFYFFFFFNVYLSLRERLRERDRERERESGGGAERGRHRIWSRLQGLSWQHSAQSRAWTLTDSEIMTWADVGCLTGWATQEPLKQILLSFLVL